VLVPSLLASSLACNIAAVTLPFMEIRRSLEGRSIYSLPRSVELLWEADLYVIAGLVAGFSIVFPFLKLLGLGWAWFGIIPARRRIRLLAWLERLGKWSFLDPFIVAVILILSSDQFFIGASPRVGLYVFIAAIALSMVAAAVIVDLTRERQEQGRRRALAAASGWERWAIPPLLVATAVGLIAAYVVPYMSIDELWLAGHSFTILRSITALWMESLYATAVLAGVTLVGAPLFSVLVIAVLWFRALTPRGVYRWRRVLEFTWQWSMLDVFGLALLVYLLEGDKLISTEIQPGLYVFASAVAALTILHGIVLWASR
jgi:paraquat-inducible protein A